MAEQVELPSVELKGIIQELLTYSQNSPLNIHIVTENGDDCYIKAWRTMKEKLADKLFEQDELYLKTQPGKKDEFNSTRLKKEILEYTIHSNNVLIVNKKPIELAEGPANELKGPDLNVDEEIAKYESAQEEIAKLPLKNVVTPKKNSKKTKEQDKEVITMPKTEQPALNIKDELFNDKKTVIPVTFDNIKKFLDPNNYMTESEIAFALVLCKTYDMNPFKKDCHIIKYSKDGLFTLVVGKDFFLSRAELQPDYLGFQAGIITEYETENELFEKMRDGSYLPKSEKLVGAWCKVYRKQKNDFVHTVTFDEYNRPSPQGKKPNSWNNIPSTMIRKVAIVQAIRECYPNYFSQLYDASEMGVELPKEE